MNTLNGYSKSTLTDNNVLTASGGHLPLELLHITPHRSSFELYDTLPMLLSGKTLGATCTIVTAGENTAPHSKVYLVSGYCSFYSPETMYFTPGETICIESWIMRPSGATGTAGTYYLGINFRDKLGKPINSNTGCIYFGQSTAWTCPCDGVWYRRYNEYTIPTSHTSYNGSDGGGYFSGTVRCLINYDKGTIPTYYGGFRIYKKNVNILVSNATSSNQILVTSNTANDTEYPLIWSNQNNTSNTQSYLYKSYNHLLYNPSKKRLTVASLFLNAGDATLKMYSAKTADAVDDGFIALQTCIDGLDGETHSYAPNYPNREAILLQPRGGKVAIGTVPQGTSKLSVAGNISLYASSGDSPRLIFQRGTITDGTYDWDLYVTGGTFKIRYNPGDATDPNNLKEKWTDVLQMYPNAITTPWNVKIDKGRLQMVGTTATPTWDSPGAITWAENANDGQPVSLVYTSYDSYRSPAGLLLTGSQGNEWFEVKGNIYSNGFVKSGSSNSYVLLGGGGHQTISSLSVNYATSANTLSSWTVAVSDDTKRYIWMSHNDNSGRACYDTDLTYLTSTDTLFVKNVYATHFITAGGISSLFVKGDGSLDDTEYASVASCPKGGNITYDKFTTPSTTSDGWYTIFTCADNTNSPCLVNVRAYAHSSMIFIVTKGWSTSGNISIIEYNSSSNNAYAWIKGARILSNGKVQINLYTGSNVNVQISVVSPRSVSLASTLVCDNTAYSDSTSVTIIDSKLGTNKTMFITDLKVSNNILATRFVKKDGTSSQFLKADGSVDSNSYMKVGNSSYPTAYYRTVTVNNTVYGFLAHTASAGFNVYAPTTVGTKGQFVLSNGSGAPIWSAIQCLSFSLNDNGGKDSYLLIANLSDWKTGTNCDVSLIGTIYGHRGGNQSLTDSYNIVALCTSYSSGNLYILYTSTYSNRTVLPYIVEYLGTKYLALRKRSSGDTIYFVGYAKGLSDTYTSCNSPSSTSLPSGMTIVYEPSYTDHALATTKLYDGTTMQTIYHAGNLSKSTLGLGNVQNTAFYERSTTVNGTAWKMAGTVNNAAFTIYAPTTAGTSGQVLTSTAGTPGWTNQSSLSVGSVSTGSVSGDTHALAIKSYFESNKSTVPRGKLISLYSSAYSNGSQYMGYFLSGYNDTPYGGFFVAHYDNPYYVGISYGAYSEQRILTSTNYTSYVNTTNFPGLNKTGTVTQVKIGSTAYDPSNGVVSLPAYPTSLPASDVYAWAKAATKPSYSFTEITPGIATIGDGANRLMFRTNASYASGMYHSTPGNESMVFANVNSVTSWIFATANAANRPDWTGLTPSLQIKNLKVAINKLIANGTEGAYNLDVNGSANATTLYENGTRVSVSGHGHYHIAVSNTRSDNNGPYNSNYNLGAVSWHLKQNSTIGVTGESTYSGMLMLSPWGDVSGGAEHHLAFGTNGGIYHRYGASTMSTWSKLAYKSEIPTKTSHLTNDSGFITSRGYLGTTAIQASSAAQAVAGITTLNMSNTLTITGGGMKVTGTAYFGGGTTYYFGSSGNVNCNTLTAASTTILKGSFLLWNSTNSYISFYNNGKTSSNLVAQIHGMAGYNTTSATYTSGTNIYFRIFSSAVNGTTISTAGYYDYIFPNVPQGLTARTVHTIFTTQQSSYTLNGTGGATGDVSLTFWRGSNASWLLLNTGGNLRFKYNYYNDKKNDTYKDALVLNYNTGKVCSPTGFYEESDERLKDFYNDVEVDLEKLIQLPKKYFRWKRDPLELNIGTSAQEVLKLYPELVTQNDEGILNVAYDKLSIIALKGIDKLYEQIKELKVRIELLENK